MKHERMMILEMVAEGQITAEEGARLLKALDENAQAGSSCCGSGGYFLVTTADDLPHDFTCPCPPMPPNTPGAPRMIIFRGGTLDDDPTVMEL